MKICAIDMVIWCFYYNILNRILKKKELKLSPELKLSTYNTGRIDDSSSLVVFVNFKLEKLFFTATCHCFFCSGLLKYPETDHLVSTFP